MSFDLHKLHNYLKEQFVAVIIVFVLALSIFGFLAKWQSELNLEEKRLSAKELNLKKMGISLRNKEKQLERLLQNIEVEKLVIQDNKKQLQNQFNNEKKISEINEKRKLLVEYVDKYLEKYSEVNFSQPIGCDENKRKLRNKAKSVLDAIYTLAKQHRNEFRNFIEFVERRKGIMVWVEPMDTCD